MTYHCDPNIGTQPMGSPSLKDVELLKKVARMHRQTIGGDNSMTTENNGRSALIADTATRILQAMISNEATANRHVITHRFDTHPKHRIRVAGPIFSRNVDDIVTTGILMRTLAGYAQKIRQLGPKTSWRLANKIESSSDILIHPAELLFIATKRAKKQDDSTSWPSVNIQPGTPRYDWLKPIATIFNIEATAPLSVLEGLPGKRLCEIIEIPNTLTPFELEAWQALVVRTVSEQEVPLGRRLNFTLDPTWQFIREPRPDPKEPERLKAWLELASVAEKI